MKTSILLTLAFLTFNQSAHAEFGTSCLDTESAHEVLAQCKYERDNCAHQLAEAAEMVQKDKTKISWYDSARLFCKIGFDSMMVTGCTWNWGTWYGMQCTDQAKEYNQCVIDLAQLIDPNVGKPSSSNQNSNSKDKPVAGKDKEKPSASVSGVTCY